MRIRGKVYTMHVIFLSIRSSVRSSVQLFLKNLDSVTTSKLHVLNLLVM